MISFHTVTTTQFELVYQLASEIWNDNYRNIISQEQINYMLKLMYKPSRIQQDILEGYIWKLIKTNNETVGYLAYVIKDDKRVFLSKIYLKTTVQGKGYGKQAINSVIDYAKNNNCNAVYLTVNKGNNKGIRAYKKTGFQIIAEEDFDIGNGFIMNDYIFEYRF